MTDTKRQELRRRVRGTLAARRAEGLNVGRPRRIDPAVEELIVRRRSQGASIRQIAAELDAAGVPTPGAKVWRHSTILRVVDRHPELARGLGSPLRGDTDHARSRAGQGTPRTSDPGAPRSDCGPAVSDVDRDGAAAPRARRSQRGRGLADRRPAGPGRPAQHRQRPMGSRCAAPPRACRDRVPGPTWIGPTSIRGP